MLHAWSFACGLQHLTERESLLCILDRRTVYRFFELHLAALASCLANAIVDNIQCGAMLYNFALDAPSVTGKERAYLLTSKKKSASWRRLGSLAD
jgi:hypothetical protein